MGFFGFLKTNKPAGFSYRPRFYDEKEDGLQERIREVLDRANDPEDSEAMKARIRRSLGRRSSYLSDRQYKQRRLMRSNFLLVVIIGALIVVTYAVLKLYLPLLLKYLG